LKIHQTRPNDKSLINHPSELFSSRIKSNQCPYTEGFFRKYQHEEKKENPLSKENKYRLAIHTFTENPQSFCVVIYHKQLVIIFNYFILFYSL